MTAYLSVCSGIEAATVAWRPLGWHALAFAEIEPFPCAVLAHHYPAVPNLGDLTRYAEWPELTPDIVVGGTPCQAFSVAGLRKGLADPRGNLTLTFLGAVDRVRPRWVVWENVPGVLSDGTGAFGAFLGGLGELGYGFAYRVLDAQYFGVPQRRRRVFVVGCLGDWRAAAAVLFESHSLSGHPAPRREAREGVASSLASRAQGGGGLGTDAEVDGALIAETVRQHPRPGSNSLGLLTSHDVAQPLLGKSNSSHRADAESYVANVLTARDHKGADPSRSVGNIVAHALKADGFDAGEDGTGRGTPLVAQTVTADMYRSGGATAGNNPGVRNVLPVAFDWQAGGSGDTSFRGKSRSYIVRKPDEAGAIQSNKVQAVMTQMAVRRLTPRECERLQGFPDDYTLVPYRGKPAADGPRYKALGNSMAVPVMAWIGRRIALVTEVLRSEAA